MRTRSWSRWGLVPLAILSATGLWGCSLLQLLAGDVRPELHFREVRLSGLSLEQVHLELVYELDNPYDVPLRLASVQYGLEVEGRRLFSGAPKEGLRIEPRQRQELVFPASIRFLDVTPTVEALFKKDSLAYRASGEVGVRTPVGVVALPLSRSGSIDVPRLPSIELAQVSVSKKSLASATLEVALDLTNPNAFPIPMGGVDFALLLSGARVGGANAGGKTLQPGQRTRLRIPVDVDLAGASQGLLALIAGKPADVGLQGRLALGGIEAPLDLRKRLAP